MQFLTAFILCVNIKNKEGKMKQNNKENIETKRNNNKKVITKTEFLKMLADKRYYSLSYVAKELIFSVFQRMELSRDEVYTIVNGAIKKEILSNKDKTYVKANLLKMVSSMHKVEDIELYKRLDEIDKIFKSYFKSCGIKQADYTAGLKDCWALAKRVNSDTNKGIISFTRDELDTLEILARLYSVIVGHVENTEITAHVKEIDPETGKYIYDKEAKKYKVVAKTFKRVADYIVSARLAELETSTLSKIKIETVEQFGRFLDAITSTAQDNAKDTFSKSEVKELLDKAISIITRVSADKYVATRNALNTYLDAILEQQDALSDTEEYQNFSSLTAKNIILRCASVLSIPTESVSFSLDFMMGRNMEEISKDLSYISQTSVAGQHIEMLKKYYPGLKLDDMDLNSHLYFAKQGISHMMVLNASSIYKTTTSFVDLVAAGLGYDQDSPSLKKKIKWLTDRGFDINSCYSKDNIFEIFNSHIFKIVNEVDNVKRNFIPQNIQTLSQYLLPKETQKIFRHNFNLLLVDPQKLKDIIHDIEVECGDDNNKFVEMFHEFINDKYSIILRSDAVSKPRSKASTKTEQTDKMEIPDKDYIEVDILGKDLTDHMEDVDVEDIDEIASWTFVDLYNDITLELTEIITFANTTETDLQEKANEFTPKYIAQILARLHINYSPSLNYIFSHVLTDLHDKIVLLETFDEFGKEEREYLTHLIDDVKLSLVSRKQRSAEILSSTDQDISVKTHQEMDKKSRINPKKYDDAIERVENLKGNSLLTKAYEKLKADVEELEVEKLLVLEENDKIHRYRTDERRPLLEKSLSYRTEIELIDKLLPGLNDCQCEITESISETQEDNEIELRERLEYLYQQRDLKVNKIKVKYAGRIRNNNFKEDDLEAIVSGNSFGKRILASIEKIDQEIAEIEFKLSSLASV